MRRIVGISSAVCLAIAAGLATAPLIAQGEAAGPPGKRDVALIQPGTYEADPHHTLVEWEVDHLGFTPYFGIFGDITGTLSIDPRAPEKAQVSVSIPIANVTTASAGLTQHLLRAPAEADGKPDFFGASPAPATFVSTSVKRKGTDAADITGNLTLNGVTKPVTLAARFYGAGNPPQEMGGGHAVGFQATATIKRSDFGIGFGVPMVSDEVKLKIAAGFMKK